MPPAAPYEGSAPPLTEAEYESLAGFRHALRRFTQFSETAAAAAGLTPQQHQALLAMRGCAERSLAVGQLADRLMIRHHSAVELADRLCAAGLARREPDAQDRRRVRLLLTDRAETVLSGLSLAHRDELRRLRPLLVELLQALGD